MWRRGLEHPAQERRPSAGGGGESAHTGRCWAVGVSGRPCPGNLEKASRTTGASAFGPASGQRSPELPQPVGPGPAWLPHSSEPRQVASNFPAVPARPARCLGQSLCPCPPTPMSASVFRLDARAFLPPPPGSLPTGITLSLSTDSLRWDKA